MSRSSKAELFAISFLSLFVELLLIKWIPAHVRVLAYFTNVILISAFFGLGVGFLLARTERRFIRFQPFLLALLAISVLVFKSFYVQTTSLHIVFQEFQKTNSAVSLYLCLTLFFVLVASVFVVLGQEIGFLFQTMPPLIAYSINIGGSILGILILTLFSYLRIPPWWQFLLYCSATLIYIAKRDGYFFLLWGIPLTVGILLLISFTDRDVIWSRYHKITLSSLLFESEEQIIWQKYLQDPATELERLPRSIGFNISINDDYFQMPLNLSDQAVSEHPYLKVWRDNYDLPYRLRRVEKVLIVAGGAGNDAAAALRHNVEEIDVVDIDGTIIEIGERFHPEKPYSDSRVRLHATDARSFFHKTDERMDSRTRGCTAFRSDFP